MKHIVTVFIIACMSVVFGLACNGEDGETAVGDGAGTSGEEDVIYEGLTQDELDMLADPDLPDDIRQLIVRSATKPYEPTTIDLIDEAEERGELNETDAMLFRLYAYTEDDKVPELYRGAEVSRSDSTMMQVNLWLKKYYETLSDELKQELRKYTLLPTDPQSFFHPDYAEAAASVSKATDVGAGMEYIEEPNRWRIYYKKGYEAKAISVHEVFTKAWPIFTNFFKGMQPNYPVYAFLSRLEKVSGLQQMKEIEGVNRCRLDIDMSIADDKWFQATAAHELFHCVHNHLYLDVDYWYKGDHKSPIESAAVLSEHLVFPDYNTEQSWLQYFYGYLNEDRLTTKSNCEEGNYMWWFFLNQYFGSPEVMVNTLEWISQFKEPRPEMFKFIPNHREAYMNFALWNFNHSDLPLSFKYIDLPLFPEKDEAKCGGWCTYAADDYEIIKEKDPRKATIRMQLNSGGMYLNIHAFIGDGVKRVVVQRSGVTVLPFLGCQAIVLLKDDTYKYLGTWLDEGEVDFCFDKPDEDLKALYVMLSNADFNVTTAMTYEIETFAKCRDSGTTKITTTSALGSSSFVADEEVMWNVEEQAYVLTKRNIEFNSNYTVEVGGISSETICLGTLPETYDPSEGRVKFWVDEDKKGGEFIPYPDVNYQTWVTCTTTTGGMPPVIEYMEPGGLYMWPRFSLTAEEITSNQIKGKREVIRNNYGGNVNTMIEFDYTLPQ